MYEDWCEGIRRGRNYVGDGRSHLLDFAVNDVRMGENGSELRLAAAGRVKVRVRAAALLHEKPNPERGRRRYRNSRTGISNAPASGTHAKCPSSLSSTAIQWRNRVSSPTAAARSDLRDDIERSSWVALRILPSSHTNPIFVLVAGRPVRASRRSAEWCLKGVDQCWSQKERFIRRDELEQAKADYEHARRTYQRLVTESEIA